MLKLDFNVRNVFQILSTLVKMLKIQSQGLSAGGEVKVPA